MEKKFSFKKKGYEFLFENLHLKNNEMKIHYKILVENGDLKSKGNALFDKNLKAVKFYSLKLDGRKISGVKLPENILNEMIEIEESFRKKDYEKKINMDIQYTLNDNTSYGIYNGISEYEIETIITDAKKKVGYDGWYLSDEDISKELSRDEEIKAIALDTYQPIKERENWKDWVKEEHRENAKNKTAEGFGMIPNIKIKEKIEKIILREKIKQDKEDKIREKQIKAIEKEKAKMELTILKQGKTKGEYGYDFYADVLVEDIETKEKAEYCCRNVFDVGYAINPSYEIAKGEIGGLQYKGYWKNFGENGWYNVRKLTEFEKKAIKYLSDFPPIDNHIRL